MVSRPPGDVICGAQEVSVIERPAGSTPRGGAKSGCLEHALDALGMTRVRCSLPSQQSAAALGNPNAYVACALTQYRRHVDLEPVFDLTTTSQFTFTLLDDTWAWRQRLVEELIVGSTWHAAVSSAYQVELPQELLPSEVDSGARAVRVLLPLTTRPKRPLLGFHIRTSSGFSGNLLLRLSIAAIQAEYLARLRDAHGGEDDLADGLPNALLEAISLFTPDVYREFDPDGQWATESAAAYLSAALDFPISRDEVAPLCECQGRAGSQLAAALQEPEDPFSSSERVLLAMARMDPLPTSMTQVSALVHAYVEAVDRAAQWSDNGMLVALAEYGRRWEVLIETIVPLREPATITLIEDRPLNLRRRTTRQLVSLGDARSAHAQFRITDPAVELGGFSVADVFGNPIGVPYLEAVRQTPEALALYSADPERPYYVEVEIELRPSLEVRLVSWSLEILVVMAIIIAASFDGRELHTVLGLVAVPTTFAVALLLVREETSLAARLQRTPRLGLLATVGVLWLVVFARLLL